MNKINVLGINVKCHNEREESLIYIIKMDVKEFYRTFKNKPHSIGGAFYMIYGKITSLYFMELINDEDYEKMTDRFFKLYKFTEKKAKKS